MRRPPLKAPIAIGSVLAGGNLLGKRGATLVDLYRIQRAWEAVVGYELYERTFPKLIRGSTLVISVENAAWAQHLSLMKDELLGAIFERVGKRFSNIRFLNEPFKRPPYA
ncbi:MAG TPA: DUF721 domain-containing protein [Bdellovibrionota bacterium]|nr:DUF721 domain-containing protein [Bdellovibrionota bacterium]